LLFLQTDFGYLRAKIHRIV